MLSRAGAIGELIELLSDDLHADPTDLALMERLSGLLLKAGRIQEAFAMMERSLGHPAGATRLLASFVESLQKAGHLDLAVQLAGAYLRKNPCDKMVVRRELAEGLRRDHQLGAAVAFLDAQAAETPGDRELAAYIPTFLINSLRSEDQLIRDQVLALLRRAARSGCRNPVGCALQAGKGPRATSAGASLVGCHSRCWFAAASSGSARMPCPSHTAGGY